ncbi:hypothetical protein X975_14789, partial [Stegodyphus mimosarum]
MRIYLIVSLKSLVLKKKKEKMFKNVKKEDPVTVLLEIGEEASADLKLVELKHKLQHSRKYIEDADFVKEILTATMDSRRRKEEIERIKMEEERLRTEREHEVD